MVPAAAITDQGLWASEVAGVRSSAAGLEPAAWISVHLVLESLAGDRTESPETRRDALSLLALLDHPSPQAAAA